MKILLTNSPWETYDYDPEGKKPPYRHYGCKAGSRWPWRDGPPAYVPYPFFLGYATTYLQRAGVDAVFYDAIALIHTTQQYIETVRRAKPDIVLIETSTPSFNVDLKIAQEVSQFAEVCLCGPHATVFAEEIVEKYPWITYVLRGEYERSSLEMCQTRRRGVYEYNHLTNEEFDAIPFPYRDATYFPQYKDTILGPHTPQLPIMEARGCAFKCLAGDTVVNTVLGEIPIKDLVGQEIGVFTYDPKDKSAKVCTAKHVMKTGENQKLVRVRFDDGTHIDCTPDHRFLAFKWGNQYKGETEWECEAKDLMPGSHVRAIRFGMSGQYLEAACSRSWRSKVHRMIMEWSVGRKLLADEVVHHKDGNKLNNAVENLEICSDGKDHFSNHPEISERMRLNNPAFNMTPEWRRKIGLANTGLKRSDESRQRYRAAALKREAAKREVVNHLVVSVEEIPGLHDTYCLEVPETHWFYANKVLVSNCTFCMWPPTMWGRKVRVFSNERILREIEDCVRRFPVKDIFFDSDTFGICPSEKIVALAKEIKKFNIPWSVMSRADLHPLDVWLELKSNGCYGYRFGVETFSPRLSKFIQKRENFDAAMVVIRGLKAAQAKIHLCTMSGFPTETDEDRAFHEARMTEVRALGCTYQVSYMVPFPGTPYYADLMARGMDFINDWDCYSGESYNSKSREMTERIVREYK